MLIQKASECELCDLSSENKINTYDSGPSLTFIHEFIITVSFYGISEN